MGNEDTLTGFPIRQVGHIHSTKLISKNKIKCLSKGIGLITD